MSEQPQQRARVSMQTLPLWRIRLARRASRLALFGSCALVALACARLGAPVAQQAPAPARSDSPGAQPDPAAAGFACEFARAYLAYSASDPEARTRALARFGGSALAPEVGAEQPPTGSRSVLSELVVGERAARPSLRVYTVAVDTEPGGAVYLAVSVFVTHGGQLALASYPAFVAAPATTTASPTLLSGAEVDEPALAQVVERALRNYLAPAPAELAADLAPHARVTTPTGHLRLEAMPQLLAGVAGRVAPGQPGPPPASAGRGTTAVSSPAERTVLAVVEASAEGARCTLAYEVDVELLGGRWEVLAIETDQGAG
ncbi:MAG: conjugal transfer protein [Solirubrobacteraceae bacterium]